MNPTIFLALCIGCIATVAALPPGKNEERKSSITIEHDEDCGCEESDPGSQPTTAQPLTTGWWDVSTNSWSAAMSTNPSAVSTTTTSTTTPTPTQTTTARAVSSTTTPFVPTTQPTVSTTSYIISPSRYNSVGQNASQCPIDECCTLQCAGGCLEKEDPSGNITVTCKYGQLPTMCMGNIPLHCFGKGCTPNSCNNANCGLRGSEICDPVVRENKAAETKEGCPLDQCCTFQCASGDVCTATTAMSGNVTTTCSRGYRPTRCLGPNGMPPFCLSKGCTLKSCNTGQSLYPTVCAKGGAELCDPVLRFNALNA